MTVWFNPMRFAERLAATVEARKSMLCCGLDPDPARLPEAIRQGRSGDAAILEFALGLIDATHDSVAAYKVQRAYFDLLDRPAAGLRAAIEHIRKKGDALVILDGKMGDMANAMRAMMRSATELGADAVVAAPYVGAEVFDCFRNGACGGVVVARTSNPGAALIQDQTLAGGAPVWGGVLAEIVAERQRGADVIPMVSASPHPGAAVALAAIPVDLPVFVAGYGEGGRGLDPLATVRAGGRRAMIVNASREVSHAFDGRQDWRQAVADAASSARARIAAWHAEG